MLRITRDALVLASTAAATVGCAAGDKRDAAAKSPPAEAQWQWTMPAPTTSYTQDRPIAVQPKPTLVKQGQMPLVYLVETGDPITIVITDLTTNQRLAAAAVGGRTIVRIDSGDGVFVGKDQVTPGPLPVAHEYGIYVEVAQQSMIRNEKIGPSSTLER